MVIRKYGRLEVYLHCSAGTQTILTKLFRGFHQSTQQHAVIVPYVTTTAVRNHNRHQEDKSGQPPAKHLTQAGWAAESIWH